MARVGGENLTEAATKDALVAATRQAGIDGAVIELLGPVADNAVFRVTHGLVGKVTFAGAFERAKREVLAAQWLLAQGVSAVRPLEEVSQPMEVSAHVVTFWHEVSGEMASTAELAALLSALHRLRPPNEPELWPLDPFVRIADRILVASNEVGSDDTRFLTDSLTRLQADFARVRDNLDTVVIHGDPNRKNVIRGDDGQAVLIDLERFGLGPREWDLVVPAVYHRLGWYSNEEYDDFVDAYGWDVRESDSFELLASIRELRMTAWLIARLPREPQLKAEAERRIASLRNPFAPRRWAPGE